MTKAGQRSPHVPGEAFGVGLTPMSSLCERCALSLEVDRSEEHGRLRRIAVAGMYAGGRQSAPLRRPMRFARCMLMVGSDLAVSTVLCAAAAVQPDDAISLRHRLSTLPMIIDSDRERFGAMRKDLRDSVFCSPRTGPKGPPSAVLAAVARAAGAPPGPLRPRTL